MPELPYVEANRQYLIDQGIVGNKITGYQILFQPAFKTPIPNLSNIIDRVIRSIERLGKFIVLDLNGYYLVFHLRMSGQLTLVKNTNAPHPHLRNIFQLEEDRSIWFVDQRKFGEIWITNDISIFENKLSPDPLGEHFTLDWLVKSTISRRKTIKSLLLEQNIVAGMGNIFADEVLFLAGLLPTRKPADLSELQYHNLYECVVRVLSDATETMVNIKPLPKPDQKSGNFKSMLYLPRTRDGCCTNCESHINSTVISQRTTYFCPECQI
ncbi:MAG: hypothetical protein FI727_02495 [SAR202 cluster bacterium]|nr:hypothetical protein [SAR202 cluster bacterium]|tara:strand:+ start:6641 stop:7444 length:804 start_codon:yes stop_codon:yes gene_type:complete